MTANQLPINMVDRKAKIGCGVVAVLVGILLIATARLLVGHLSWGFRWLITVLGWLTIGAVIVPLCERVTKSGRRKK